MLSNNFGRRVRGVEVRLKCCWRDRSVWCRRPFNIFVVLTKAHATMLTTRVKQREGVWGGWMTSCMAAPTQNRRRGRHRDFLNLGHFRPLFPLFLTFQQLSISLLISPMTGFEPGISGIWSDRSANWATTTSRPEIFVTSPAKPIQSCYQVGNISRLYLTENCPSTRNVEIMKSPKLLATCWWSRYSDFCKIIRCLAGVNIANSRFKLESALLKGHFLRSSASSLITGQHSFQQK